jgi:threonine dehydrogenase-like Zn-dependent dehydrogenase
MKAVTWHGKRDVWVDTVPDPKVEEPTDAIIEVTSTTVDPTSISMRCSVPS